MLEIIIPLIKDKIKKFQHKKLIKALHSSSCFNDRLTDKFESTVNDYMELIIQFGFLTLFGLAFPLIFIVAYIFNLFEIRVDSTVLLKFTNRTDLNKATGIGIWGEILSLLCTVGIISNLLLMIFS